MQYDWSWQRLFFSFLPPADPVWGINPSTITRWTADALTIGDVRDLAEDVISAYLFITLWWTNQCLTDHGDIDFGTNTAVCGLEKKMKTSMQNNTQASKDLPVAERAERWKLVGPKLTFLSSIYTNK